MARKASDRVSERLEFVKLASRSIFRSQRFGVLGSGGCNLTEIFRKLRWRMCETA